MQSTVNPSTGGLLDGSNKMAIPTALEGILQTVDQKIGEALGQLYVRRTFSLATKARAEQMVMNLVSE